jgi:hypothetical protein
MSKKTLLPLVMGSSSAPGSSLARVLDLRIRNKASKNCKKNRAGCARGPPIALIIIIATGLRALNKDIALWQLCLQGPLCRFSVWIKIASAKTYLENFEGQLQCE